MKFLFTLISCLFFIPAFVPLKEIYSEFPISALTRNSFYWLNNIVILLSIAFLLDNFIKKKLNFFNEQLLTYYKKFLYLAFIFWLIVIGKYVFSWRPTLIDSVAQLFQAKVFSNFQMASSPPKDLYEFFYTQNLLFTANGIFSQYPPMNSILLAIGEIFNLMYIVPIIVGVLALYFTDKFYQSYLNKTEATYSIYLLALSPFFAFLAMSYMNHTTTLMFLSLFCWQITLYKKENSRKNLYYSLIALGLAFSTRPIEAMIVGLFFIIPVFLRDIKKIDFNLVIFSALSFFPGIMIYFIYNFYSTGEFLKPGYLELWGDAHKFGFHYSPYAKYYTIYEALRNLLINMSLLNEFLFETPIPILYLLPLFFISGYASKKDYELLLISLAMPIVYFFYWHSDDYLGPRFYYQSIIFLIPLLIRSFINLSKINYSFHISNNFEFNFQRTFIYFNLLIFIFVIFRGIPDRFEIYSSSFLSFRKDMAKIAESQKIEEGIIFVPVSWGSRIISHLRGAGFPAWKTQEAYKFVDHCKLHLIIEALKSKIITYEQMANEIEKLFKKKEPLLAPNLNNDRSLRITKFFPKECREQILYDNLGYTIFSPYINDNNYDFNSKLIIVNDLQKYNHLFAKKYPNKKTYIFRNNIISPLILEK